MKIFIFSILMFCIYKLEGTEYINDKEISSLHMFCCPKTPFIIKKEGGHFDLEFEWEKSKGCLKWGITENLRQIISTDDYSWFRLPNMKEEVFMKIWIVEDDLRLPFLQEWTYLSFHLYKGKDEICGMQLYPERKVASWSRKLRKFVDEEL